MSSTVTAIETENAATAWLGDPPVSPEIAVGDSEIAVADAAVARVRAAARSRATAEAELAAAIVGVADLCDDREHDSSEVAAVLAWSTRFAESEVGWCRSLIERLPEVFAAWQAGQIDRHRARVFEDCLWPLILAGNEDGARAIAGRVLPEAGRITAPRLRAKLMSLVLKIDPEARRKQAAQTIADRNVWLGDGGDGATASLTAFNLPVGRATAAFERVDAIARARRAGGDARTLAQLRADTVLDLLDGTGCDTPPIGRQGVLELHIPLATAIGADTTPGELAGYGPVLSDVARQIARQRGDLQWRFSVTYRGELVYQGITSARPESDRGGDCEGGNVGSQDGASTADPAAAVQSSLPPDPVVDSRRSAGTKGAVTSSDSGADDSTGCGTRTDRSTTGDSGITGFVREDGGVDGADTDDEPSRTARGRLGNRVPDPGTTTSAPRLADYLTGQPITGIDAHTAHPPIEADPRRRFPGEKLKRWIATRDRTCRAPGCHAPARVCQFDHTIDYADGGETSHDDLALLCEHHHSEKHAGWWTVIQPIPGRIYWITPHGHIYRQAD